HPGHTRGVGDRQRARVGQRRGHVDAELATLMRAEVLLVGELGGSWLVHGGQGVPPAGGDERVRVTTTRPGGAPLPAWSCRPTGVYGRSADCARVARPPTDAAVRSVWQRRTCMSAAGITVAVCFFRRSEAV